MCVSKVKNMGPFLASSVEINEKMSFKMDVKFAVPLYICAGFFEKYCS